MRRTSPPRRARLLRLAATGGPSNLCDRTMARPQGRHTLRETEKGEEGTTRPPPREGRRPTTRGAITRRSRPTATGAPVHMGPAVVSPHAPSPGARPTPRFRGPHLHVPALKSRSRVPAPSHAFRPTPPHPPNACELPPRPFYGSCTPAQAPDVYPFAPRTRTGNPHPRRVLCPGAPQRVPPPNDEEPRLPFAHLGPVVRSPLTRPPDPAYRTPFVLPAYLRRPGDQGRKAGACCTMFLNNIQYSWTLHKFSRHCPTVLSVTSCFREERGRLDTKKNWPG